MTNFVEGIHPVTGEILKVQVNGNFPFKNPETNEFIVDAAGAVVVPGRERERFARLDSQRREVPDPRPMSSAVAFAFDITPEEEVRRLIASSQARIDANYARAEESDVEFYDDDDLDFGSADHGGVDNMTSPFEFVRDAVMGDEVPRGLLGMFKRKETDVSDVERPESDLPPVKGIKAPKKPTSLPAKEESSADDSLDQ